METHEPDPRGEDDTHPWATFQSELGELGQRLRDTYRNVSEGGPSEEEIRDALGTLAGAWGQLAGSVSSALRDPEVRSRLEDAAGAFAAAVGRTLSDLRTELGETGRQTPESAEDEE